MTALIVVACVIAYILVGIPVSAAMYVWNHAVGDRPTPGMDEDARITYSFLVLVWPIAFIFLVVVGIFSGFVFASKLMGAVIDKCVEAIAKIADRKRVHT